MDKKQLVEYLDAVCDAESAVQACDDAIALFEGQRRRVPVPTEPYAPVHGVAAKRDMKADKVWGLVKWIIWFPLWIAYCFVFEFLGWSMEVGGSTPHGLACAIVTAIVISRALQKHMDERKSKAVFAQEQQQVALRNQQADQQYREKMASYEEAKRCYEAAVGALDGHIHRQQEIRGEVRMRLDKLYSLDVIYPSFRNLIAVYQIREYLQMGICDTLEGPTGAYAQYMNDVRAARICESITDLKRSLTAAINGLQGTLACELRQIESNLDCLRSDMNTSVQRLNAQMQQMHTASAAQLDAHFSEANRQLSAISNTLAISEHNRYIERRLNKVDTYLMKLP